jgi:hypothetical protein
MEMNSANMWRTISWMSDIEVLNCFQQVEEYMGGNAELICSDERIADTDVDVSEMNQNCEAPILTRSGPPHTSLTKPVKSSSGWIFKGHCADGCKCKCHSTPACRFAVPFRASFGRIFPAIRGDPKLVHRCNRLQCRNRTARRRQLIVLPPILMKRAIVLSLISRGIRFKIQLRSCPFVPETSEVIMYSINGNLDGLKGLITTGRASVFSTAQDGWTLLHVSAIPCLPV